MKRVLDALRSRLLIIPLAAIVFAGALGAGFQWGAPDEASFVRVFDGRVGGDGAPQADVEGFVTQRGADSITVRSGDQTIEVPIAADAVIERLARIGLPQIELGEWIVVGGEDDNVNTFILKGIVAISAEEAIVGDGAASLAQARP